MKQVVFAVLLMAMASLTGCLNGDDSPVDENIDTTDDSTSDTTEDNSDTTDDTKDDELIEPVGVTGYTPPDKANITVNSDANQPGGIDWVAKDGHRITTSCLSSLSQTYARNFIIYDSDDRIIYLGNDPVDYGASDCGNAGLKFDVTLGPEPVKVAIADGLCYVSSDYIACNNNYDWIVTF